MEEKGGLKLVLKTYKNSNNTLHIVNLHSS